MNSKRLALIAGMGCVSLLLVAAMAILVLYFLPIRVEVSTAEQVAETTAVPGAAATQRVVPTIALAEPTGRTRQQPTVRVRGAQLTDLYARLNPGVVSIQVFVRRGPFGGQGAGSGFVLNDQGHIVTNNHVVQGAERVTVKFYNGVEVEADIVGTDADSDLAVLQVDELPQDVAVLAMGDSEGVDVGDWVAAIGNPFGLGGSLTVGVVSAVGRTIPSGATPFAISQAIQTDAAINPGNSGGPLFNLDGEVIGVNAQIATGGGSQANAGVGFAIPANVVRRVVPVLIESGSFQWPWLGVRGDSVNLAIQEANDLDTQRGAYIGEIVSGGPAAEAGLQGATDVTTIDGIRVPVGGDVVLAIDGNEVLDWSDLLFQISTQSPGDEVVLTVLRGGERQEITVELAARPRDFERE